MINIEENISLLSCKIVSHTMNSITLNESDAERASDIFKDLCIKHEIGLCGDDAYYLRKTIKFLE